ncbi:MAG: PBSX family phage terminase large subunit [Planctomycetota bacterium]|jgi:phage terminase large subunit
METNLQIDYPFDVLYDPYDYIGFYGGRGGGKSHAIAESLVLAAMQKKERILCGREIQLSIRDSVKFLLEKKIKDLGLDDYFEITRDEIRCRTTGSVFIFKGLSDQTSESIKSFEGITVYWGEEAHMITQRSLNLLLPTIREDGAKVIFSWNPKLPNDPEDGSPGDPVAKFLLWKGGPNKSVTRKVSWRDNKFFPARLNELRIWWKTHDPKRYMHVWEGEPDVRSDALVFYRWSISDFVAPTGTNFLFGADWGFSNDPTTLIRFWVDMPKRKLFIDHEVYKVGVEVTDTPALFLQVPGSINHRIIADSANPQLISHMRKCNFRITGAKKGAGSVEVGVKWLQDFDIVVHSRCTNTIRELSLYSYKVDKITDKPTPALVDDNNHIIDALRYGAEDLIRKGDLIARVIKMVAV